MVGGDNATSGRKQNNEATRKCTNFFYFRLALWQFALHRQERRGGGGGDNARYARNNKKQPPDNASHADPNEQAQAESLHRSIVAFPVSCMVAIASAGISGVCSVAGRVGVERFLEVLPWSCGLFPIEPIARNAARKHVGKPKELTSTNHAKQILFGEGEQS